MRMNPKTRGRLPAARTAVIVASCLAAILASGCAQGARRTAAGIAKGYGGIIEGEAARLIEDNPNLDKLFKDGRATKRTYAEGSGRNRIEVTETLVLGEPYQVEVKFLRYFDPVAEIRDEDAVRIVHGSSKDEGLDIRDPADIRRILRALRTESYKHDKEVAWREYRRTDGNLPLGGIGTYDEMGAGSQDCLWIHKRDGRAVCVGVYVPPDTFDRFYNPAVFEPLKTAAAKAGYRYDEKGRFFCKPRPTTAP